MCVLDMHTLGLALYLDFGSGSVIFVKGHLEQEDKGGETCALLFKRLFHLNKDHRFDLAIFLTLSLSFTGKKNTANVRRVTAITTVKNKNNQRCRPGQTATQSNASCM